MKRALIVLTGFLMTLAIAQQVYAAFAKDRDRHETTHGPGQGGSPGV